MQSAAREAEGEGASQGHQPERASESPVRSQFPGSPASPSPPHTAAEGSG